MMAKGVKGTATSAEAGGTEANGGAGATHGTGDSVMVVMISARGNPTHMEQKPHVANLAA